MIFHLLDHLIEMNILAIFLNNLYKKIKGHGLSVRNFNDYLKAYFERI